VGKFSVFRNSLGVTAIVLCTIVGCLNAGWWRTYGGDNQDWGRCVQQTTDGGYVITGYTSSFGAGNLWFLKTDAEGEILWTRTYGADTHTEYGYCVQQTNDSGYVIIGEKTYWEDWENKGDIWLLKTDLQGDTIWTRSYTRGKILDSDMLFGYCYGSQTKDSGYAIIATKGKDVWLLKTDPKGDTLWTRTYVVDENYHPFAYCVQQTSDGGYIATGEAWNFSDPGAHGFAWVLKTNEIGDTTWMRYIDLDDFTGGNFVKQTTDGGYIITGYTSRAIGQVGYPRLLLTKVDSGGKTSWIRRYGDEYGWNKGHCVDQTTDGGYIITGTWTLLKTDGVGDTLWTRCYGNKSYFVRQTKDLGYIVVGRTTSSYPQEWDLWLCKTDSLGLVAVSEPVTPVTQADWQVSVSVGRQIVLRAPDGSAPLDLAVFDASGRKVDELHSNQPSGTITWGEGHGAGVYFIRIEGDASATTHKVILIH